MFIYINMQINKQTVCAEWCVTCKLIADVLLMEIRVPLCTPRDDLNFDMNAGMGLIEN